MSDLLISISIYIVEGFEDGEDQTQDDDTYSNNNWSYMMHAIMEYDTARAK